MAHNESDYPYITAKAFGDVVKYDLFKKEPRKASNQLFAVIRQRIDKTLDLMNNYKDSYMLVTETKDIRDIKSNLFTGLDGIHFYDWGNKWLVCFQERSILGEIKRFISNEEMDKILGQL